MVKLLALLLFSHTLNAASLELKLSRQHVEMGKSITATFTYQGRTQPNPIDLSLWQNNFYIEQDDADTSNLDTQTIISISKARLYPRRTGQITLDAIAQGGSFVKPQTINVSASIRNNIDATPQIHPLKNTYWADQAIPIRIDVARHDPRNQIIAKEWLVEGFNITPLPSIKTATRVQLQWLIYTPAQGLYELELPAIIQRGRGRFRYHLPKLKLNIKPLPAYLPGSVATGKPHISSQVIQKNQNKILQLTLSKQGHLPQNIEGLQQFIQHLSSDELALNIQTTEQQQHGTTTRHIYITLPNWLWGQKRNIELTYFNTQTGQTDILKHALPRLYTIPQSAQQLMIALSLAFLLIALQQLNKKAITWRKKKAIKQSIRRAKNSQELRNILLNNGQYKTLEEWAQHNPSQQTQHIKNQLNQACYQYNNPIQLSTLKKAIQKLKTGQQWPN